MRTKLSFAALAALALASCSSDELLEQNTGAAINFSVVANKATRAGMDNNTLTEFKVWAYKNNTNKDLFINGSTCAKTEGSTDWKFDGSTLFWPTENLNFFMTAPLSVTPAMTSESQKVDFTVTGGSVDFVYAMCEDKKKNDHLANPIDVNFRHALSEIVFKVANTNAKLRIKVLGIRIVGINDKGTYTLANKDTYAGGVDASKAAGSWASQASSKTEIKDVIYTAYSDATGVTLEGVSAVTGTNLAGAEGATAPLYLLPQELPSWKVTNNGSSYTAEGTARIEVLCVIDQNVNASTWSQIWPVTGTEAQYVAITLDNKTEAGLDWEQGKKYIYTLSFGEGAGYDPTTPTNPKPAIVPIKAKVTVDSFIDGNAVNGNVKPVE